MSIILITGASGFIGKALALSMSEKHEVVCLSRKNPGLSNVSFVRGSFAKQKDLKRLDTLNFDAVIHLAAVTGGCTESDGVIVNCEGSRELMRYLIDRGCTKFVMASSIALVGNQSMEFRPLQVPIPDEHPCLDRDGYGFSKHLMEQITHFYSRQNDQIDVINLRLCSVAKEGSAPSGMRDIKPWALRGITAMLLSDAVALFTKAAESPYKPGVRTMNASCSRAWTTVPTADLLKHWWGNDVDLSYFLQEGKQYDSVYNINQLEKELGFSAVNTLKVLNRI